MNLSGIADKDRPDYWQRRLKALEDEVAKLRTARVGNAMVVDGSPGITVQNGGGLTISDGGQLRLTTANGTVILYVGTNKIPDGSGRSQQEFFLARDDGSSAFYVADVGTIPNHPHQQAWALLDRAGNIVMAEDTVGGVGLANPYIPLGQFVDITAPTATTTSTSFVAMQWCDAYLQHPKIRGSVLAQTPAGVTGQFRFTIGGVQIGSAVNVSAGFFGQLAFPITAWPAGQFTYEKSITLQLEGRVTGGTGALGLRTLGMWGVQS
jgi:hypothetical protein